MAQSKEASNLKTQSQKQGLAYSTFRTPKIQTSKRPSPIDIADVFKTPKQQKNTSFFNKSPISDTNAPIKASNFQEIIKRMWTLTRPHKNFLTYCLCKECKNRLFNNQDKLRTDTQNELVTINLTLCKRCAENNIKASIYRYYNDGPGINKAQQTKTESSKNKKEIEILL